MDSAKNTVSTHTTLDELKEIRDCLNFKKKQFRKDSIASIGPQVKTNSFYTQRSPSEQEPTTPSIYQSQSLEKREPSSADYVKLLLEYFTQELILPLTLPKDSYEILKRLATWPSVFRIAFNQASLDKLESALQILVDTWGPNFILVKEKQSGSRRRLIIEKFDLDKLNVAKNLESSLGDGVGSPLKKSLELRTSTIAISKKRKYKQILSEDDTDLKDIEALLAKPSFQEREDKRTLKELCEILDKKSSKDKLINEMFLSTNNAFREFCVYGTKVDCRRQRKTPRACRRLHFRPMLRPHTEVELGDCSYLNTCHRMDTCKYVHYELDDDEVEWRYLQRKAIPPSVVFTPPTKVLPPQWINCDVRKFDFSVLGKFTVIMADPPWDIHMTLPYGTMTDDEMKAMAIANLQDEGLIFLWVTGRAMELGRECLNIWGYDRADELVWIKTNQLQRLIRTGRTGHWLNHSKEHCLVGIKGNPEILNWGLDCDVLVGEVRETSRKPDEVYGLIDRLAPGTRKLEIFGRPHNTRPGWLTLGNQLDAVRLYESDVVGKYNARYPETPCKETPLPPDW